MININIDFGKNQEMCKHYVEFISQVSDLDTKDYVTKYKLYENEMFIRILLNSSNPELWKPASTKFNPRIMLKIIKEEPKIIIHIMSIAFTMLYTVKIIDSLDDVTMFYRHFMEYLTYNYINEKTLCNYSKTYGALADKNRLLLGNNHISCVMEKLSKL